MFAPLRRLTRLQFSLRGLLLVTALVGCWLGYYINWIHQRREMRVWIGQHVRLKLHPPSKFYDGTANLPWPLRLLGEEFVSMIDVIAHNSRPDYNEQEFQAQIRRIRALFPEATVAVEVPELPPRN